MILLERKNKSKTLTSFIFFDSFFFFVDFKEGVSSFLEKRQARFPPLNLKNPVIEHVNILMKGPGSKM